jgi:hypothetical protein
MIGFAPISVELALTIVGAVVAGSIGYIAGRSRKAREASKTRERTEQQVYVDDLAASEFPALAGTKKTADR